MSNDLIENRHPKLALPIGNIMVPKFLYAILVVLGVLILVVGGLNLYFNKAKTVSVPAAKLTNLEMAKMTLDWIYKQKNDGGIYTVGSVCDYNFNCKTQRFTQMSDFSLLWAENRYVQKNNNEKELKILKNNVDLYTHENVVKLMNNNFWNCYFLWDVWNNSSLSQDTKDNLERVCFENKYSSSYMDINGVNIKKTQEFTKNLVLDVVNNKATVDQQLESTLVVKEDLIENVARHQYFFNSSDRLVRYLWRKDEKELSDGLIDFQQSLDTYKNEQIKVKPYEGCQTGIASLMLSNIFNDFKYLDLSKIILDQQTEKINKNSIKDVSVCGLLANELYKKTGDKSFEEKKNNIISEFLINNFDKKNGGFYSRTEASLIKDIIYNGLMIGILVD